MNQHVQRWITGIIAGPLLILFIIFSSEALFSLFVFAIVQFALWEYNRLSFGKNECLLEKYELYIFSALLIFSAYLGNFELILSTITFCLLASFILFLYQINNYSIDTKKIEKVVFGFLYIPLLMSSLVLLRHLSFGVKWVILTIIIAFCGDFSGFYTGKTLGKRKLQPFVSPGKTIEGTLGQISGSILGAILFQQLAFKELLFMHAVILGIAGGIMGQLGDLFESTLKRSTGVKDAGHILPGHGGIMDRMDSLNFIAPFVYYYQYFIIR